MEHDAARLAGTLVSAPHDDDAALEALAERLARVCAHADLAERDAALRDTLRAALHMSELSMDTLLDRIDRLVRASLRAGTARADLALSPHMCAALARVLRPYTQARL